MATIFSKIIAGELPSEKVFENQHVLVIKDRYPIAPVHLLIIPKKEIRDLQHLLAADFHLIGQIVELVQQLAEDFELENGYRLVTNVGADGGQTIAHLHFHLIGGKPLTEQMG